MKYYMEIKMYNPTTETEEWAKVHPTNGKAYAYDTMKEAQDMLEICYPEQIYGTEKRVVKE